MLGIHVRHQRRPRHPRPLRRQRRRQREDVVHHHVGPQLLEQRRKRHRRLPSRRPVRHPGARTRGIPRRRGTPHPASSSTSRHFSHVSKTTRCPRSRSARASAIAGNVCPGSPNAATSTRSSPAHTRTACNISFRIPAEHSTRRPPGAIPCRVRPKRDRPTYRLRLAVEQLPRHTKEAMLRGIDTNRIIVGAYVDSRSGGICPMLAAHRNGGRTSVASFARAWDAYTGAKRPRRATRREVRTLRSLLEWSLGTSSELARRLPCRGRRPDPRRARAIPLRRATSPWSNPERRPGGHQRSPAATGRARGAAEEQLTEATTPRSSWARRSASPAERQLRSPYTRHLLRRVPRAQEHDLRHQARGRRAQQEPHRLRDVLGADHVARPSTWPLTNSVIGVSTNAGHERRHLDPLTVDLPLRRLAEADHPGLRRRIDRQPRLARLPRDRRQCSRSAPSRARPPPRAASAAPSRVARIRPRRFAPSWMSSFFAVICVHRLPDPHAGAVHQHVEAPEPLAVRIDQRHDLAPRRPSAPGARARRAPPSAARRPRPRACPAAAPRSSPRSRPRRAHARSPARSRSILP